MASEALPESATCGRRSEVGNEHVSEVRKASERRLCLSGSSCVRLHGRTRKQRAVSVTGRNCHCARPGNTSQHTHTHTFTPHTSTTVCVRLCVCVQTVGGGWIQAQNSSGQTGLVPEGYLQVSAHFTVCHRPAPITRPSRSLPVSQTVLSTKKLLKLPQNVPEIQETHIKHHKPSPNYHQTSPNYQKHLRTTLTKRKRRGGVESLLTNHRLDLLAVTVTASVNSPSNPSANVTFQI